MRFGGVLKVVEKYSEAEPGLVCMSCVGINHNRLGECGDKTVQCIICVSAYKVKNHRCGVIGYTVKIDKVCTHVTLKYVNDGENHRATAFRCPARLKAQAETWKEKVKKSQAKDKQPATHAVLEEEPAMEPSKIKLDTALTLWAKSLR